MKTILLAAALGIAFQASDCGDTETAKPAPVPPEDGQTQTFFRERSMEEMRRLFATERLQVIAGCRYVQVGRDGGYIVLLHPEDSDEYVLGSVNVSTEGEVTSNSLPDNLTFDQLMELTRQARHSQYDGRRICGKEVAR